MFSSSLIDLQRHPQRQQIVPSEGLSLILTQKALECIYQNFEQNLDIFYEEVYSINLPQRRIFPTQQLILYISAEQQHSMLLASRTEDANATQGSNSGKRKPYTCRKCGHPKKGHRQCPGS